MKITGIEAGLLLCALRHFDERQSMETAYLVHEFEGTHVLGFDIAGDEAGYPVTNHVKAFSFARSKNIRCTAHAGEAKGAESVWETLHEFRPLRIGHGIRSFEDPALMAFLKREAIHLEVCPTSNIQTNVYESIEVHTADKIFRSGISMSISTDARTITDTTLAREYALMEKIFQWNKEHFLKCNLEAIDHSFITEERKVILRERIRSGYQ